MSDEIKLDYDVQWLVEHNDVAETKRFALQRLQYGYDNNLDCQTLPDDQLNIEVEDVVKDNEISINNSSIAVAQQVVPEATVKRAFKELNDEERKEFDRLKGYAEYYFSLLGDVYIVDDPKKPNRMDVVRNWYSILGYGLNHKIDTEKVKAEVKRRQRQSHPDKFNFFLSQHYSPEFEVEVSLLREKSQAYFKELTTAQQILTDDQRRADYDSLIADGIAYTPSTGEEKDVSRGKNLVETSLKEIRETPDFNDIVKWLSFLSDIEVQFEMNRNEEGNERQLIVSAKSLLASVIDILRLENAGRIEEVKEKLSEMPDTWRIRNRLCLHLLVDKSRHLGFELSETADSDSNPARMFMHSLNSEFAYKYAWRISPRSTNYG